MSSLAVYQILIAIFIVLSGIFSGTETAITSTNILKLQALAKKKKRRAVAALHLVQKRENSISMILIGNNIANITATAFITYVATKSYLVSDSISFIITVGQSIFFLIFCEIMPKIIARSFPERFLMMFAYSATFLIYLFYPLIKVSLAITGVFKKILHISGEKPITSSRDEIGFLFSLGKQGGVIEGDFQTYVDEILELHHTKATEIMIPIVDILSYDVNKGLKNLVKVIENTKFSRIPVYENRVDNIIGYVHFKDLLYRGLDVELKKIVHQPVYIPETKNIYDLYEEMKTKHVPMVFVVNEFGGVTGLITKEDIAEEIVGEIQTKDHPVCNLIEKTKNSHYILSGDLDIEFFERSFPIHIEKNGFQTVAGFINAQLGKIGIIGDSLEYHGAIFTVVEATSRSVEKVDVVFQTKEKKKKKN